MIRLLLPQSELSRNCHIPEIPWKEVVVTLRVGKIGGKYAINPLISLMVNSMDMIVSVTENPS